MVCFSDKCGCACDHFWCGKTETGPLRIETLNSQVGLSWAEIGRNLGVPESTIRRRRRSFVSAYANMESHSTTSDNDLDIPVRGILQIAPRTGYIDQH